MGISKLKKPGELLNWEDIQKMKYSWNVACEVLRLSPPSLGSLWEAVNDFVFSGFSIPKGLEEPKNKATYSCQIVIFDNCHELVDNRLKLIEFDFRFCSVNCAALERYKWIINRVRSFGMKVTLTFFHHSLPPWAAEYGCWKMEKTVDYFMDFTRLALLLGIPVLDFLVTFFGLFLIIGSGLMVMVPRLVAVDYANGLARIPRPSYHLFTQVVTTGKVTREDWACAWNELQTAAKEKKKRPFCRSMSRIWFMRMDTCEHNCRVCVILLAIAEETLAEFLSKASRTAVDWVQMIEMKTFAPTTFAAAQDFWTLRYSTNYEC
ncbi:hypothetical protein EZV62_009079 [Acer yangbiense]|uniref:Uncharacterized protein n=1 Tax=Acer yangbiense TaxID=1000413 RepID=A0A5C7IFM6_9ROSI|nr:hypothetical protein EZV62_009079 [Acer yangbiense]